MKNNGAPYKKPFCDNFGCRGAIYVKWNQKRGKPKIKTSFRLSEGCLHEFMIFYWPITSPLQNKTFENRFRVSRSNIDFE